MILNQLEEVYSSLHTSELIETEPRVGLPCVTRFSDDKRFYRAQIVAIDGSNARVEFVDYGNEDQVPLSELKRIVPCFMAFPKTVKTLMPFYFKKKKKIMFFSFR